MRVFGCCLLSFLLFGQPASAQLQPATKDTIAATRYQLPGADCALFPKRANMGYWYNEKTLLSTGRFTPTHAQVITAEKALKTIHLETVYAHQPSSYYADYPKIIAQSLPKYQRQYFGFYNSRHQSCLYINFFIEKWEEAPGTTPHWLCTPIEVADGGAGFWRIFYNLTTQKFYDFSHGLEG